MQFFFQLCNFLMLFYYIQMGAPTSTRSFADECRILRHFPLLLVSLCISGHPLASHHRFLFSYYLNIKVPKDSVPSSPLNYTICLDNLTHVQSPPSPTTTTVTSAQPHSSSSTTTAPTCLCTSPCKYLTEQKEKVECGQTKIDYNPFLAFTPDLFLPLTFLP